MLRNFLIAAVCLLSAVSIHAQNSAAPGSVVPNAQGDFISPEHDPAFIPSKQRFITSCDARNPLQMMKMFPRVFLQRQDDPSSRGWRPVKKTVLDIKLKNRSTREIAAVHFKIQDGYQQRYLDVYWVLDSDDSRFGGPRLLPDHEYTLSYRPLLDIHDDSLSMRVKQIRFSDGELLDLDDCPLGRMAVPSEATYPPYLQANIADASSSCESMQNMSEAIWPPKAIEIPSIQTPDAADHGGTVTVGFCVDKHGIPRNLRIMTSAGVVLDATAMTTIAQFRFLPAVADGQPVAVDFRENINFQTGAEWTRALGSSE